MNRRQRTRAWRVFDQRDRLALRAQIDTGHQPFCPRCAAPLEAQPDSRLRAVLPPGARGYDLDCRRCRRFHARVTLSEESLYYLRIRRLARAILRA